MKNKSLVLLLSLLLAVGTMACTTTAPPATPASATKPAAATAAAAPTAAATKPAAPTAAATAAAKADNAKQTVTDMNGKQVTLPAKVNTIIDTWSAATDNLFNLGAGDKLISAHSAAKTKWAIKIHPPMATLPDLSKATAEELLKANADMVLVSSEQKSDELRAANINAINLFYSNYDSFKKSTITMGQILGPQYEAKAKQLAGYVDEIIQKTDALFGDLKDEERPVVYYTMASADATNLYASAGGGSIIDEWVKHAGGKLATADLGKGMGLRDVTPEQILKTNPDIILIDGAKAAEMRDNFYKAPEWADIKAVKNKKIYAIPIGSFMWGRLCGDTPLQILWASNVIHPDKANFDMKQITKDFYKTYKQTELSDAEVSELLRTDLLPK